MLSGECKSQTHIIEPSDMDAVVAEVAAVVAEVTAVVEETPAVGGS